MSTDKKRVKGWIVAVDELTDQQLADLSNGDSYQYTAYQETGSLGYVLLYYHSLKTYPSPVWSRCVYEPIDHFAKYVEANVEPSEWKEFGTRPEYGSRRRTMRKKEDYIGDTIAAEVYTRFADMRETIDRVKYSLVQLQQCQRDLVEEEMDILTTGNMDIESYAKELERIAYAIATEKPPSAAGEFSAYIKSLRSRNRKRTEEEKEKSAMTYVSKKSKRGETKEEKEYRRMISEKRALEDARAWRRQAEEHRQRELKRKTR